MLPEPMIVSHRLKIEPEYFLAQIREKKRFELRRNNDRVFSAGQFARLDEIDKLTGKETGNFAIVKILYVLTNVAGLHCDYCILSTALICFQYERDENAD